MQISELTWMESPFSKTTKDVEHIVQHNVTDKTKKFAFMTLDEGLNDDSVVVATFGNAQNDQA